MHTLTQKPAATQPLVEPWQTHLKFNGRAPRTLHELGVARVDYEHRHQLANLKAISKKLEQLEALLPALADQGIKIHQREFRTYNGGKTIWLSDFFGTDDKLHQALLGLGFRETKRTETHVGSRTDRVDLKHGSRTDRVDLKHGRSLVVVLEVSKLPAPQLAATVAA